jgi:hypothetical protein
MLRIGDNVESNKVLTGVAKLGVVQPPALTSPEVIPTSPYSLTTICRSSPPALRGLWRLRCTLASSHA